MHLKSAHILQNKMTGHFETLTGCDKVLLVFCIVFKLIFFLTVFKLPFLYLVLPFKLLFLFCVMPLEAWHKALYQFSFIIIIIYSVLLLIL